MYRDQLEASLARIETLERELATHTERAEASGGEIEQLRADLARERAVSEELRLQLASLGMGSPRAEGVELGPPLGRARRYVPDQMKTTMLWERSLWPTAAVASSTYGGGWSPEELRGPPSVFPACGDRAGAWAPKTRRSATEWIEVVFEEGPPASSIRVFETCSPGATFAVAVREAGSEVLVWRGEARGPERTARALEVDLEPPRVVRAVRVYVRNDLSDDWVEIDTVALVCTEELPPERRARPRRGKRVIKWVGIGAALVGLAWFLGAPSAPPTRSRPNETLAGSTMRETTTLDSAHRNTAWASRVIDMSSQYQASSRGAVGEPDVFPAHADSWLAWAPASPDSENEWISVGFSRAVLATEVIVVETFHPGALVRIDDVTDASRPVVLWEGATVSAFGSRVLRLQLPAPRRIGALRLVLEPTRVAGWNEVDAVGLVPAR